MIAMVQAILTHMTTPDHRVWDKWPTFCRRYFRRFEFPLTHWGRVTEICVSKPTIIGSDNGLSPGRRQAIIWTNAKVLWIGPMGINFNDILIEIYSFSFTKMHLKMSFGIDHFVSASMCDGQVLTHIRVTGPKWVLFHQQLERLGREIMYLSAVVAQCWQKIWIHLKILKNGKMMEIRKLAN